MSELNPKPNKDTDLMEVVPLLVYGTLYFVREPVCNIKYLSIKYSIQSGAIPVNLFNRP